MNNAPTASDEMQGFHPRTIHRKDEEERGLGQEPPSEDSLSSLPASAAARLRPTCTPIDSSIAPRRGNNGEQLHLYLVSSLRTFQYVNHMI
jgi:hypothetical protein